MTLIKPSNILLGSICGVLLLLISNSCTQSSAHYSELEVVSVPNFNKDFPNYCRLDSTRDFQQNATLCTFVGDYSGAVDFATKEAMLRRQTNSTTGLTPEEAELLLNDSSYGEDEKAFARTALMVLDQKDMAQAFEDLRSVNAKEFVITESSKYHFLLINEAHYSQQNRKFTTDLLEPLWKKGYRYLALEALGYGDSDLMRRGYPSLKSGYYLRDAVFGNFIREALSIGYEVVPYEAQKDVAASPTARDKEQALNIYNSTYMKDSVGKVIVHAGYSHIYEGGSSEYEPMGFQLGQLSGQKIFTIDQQSMTEFSNSKAMNAYYNYAIERFKFHLPVVFLTENGDPFVEPLNAAGIDVQVFHPLTTYIKGRPSWLLKDGYKAHSLPPDLLKFEGNLLQVVPVGEESISIPVDQLVIKSDRALILGPGSYTLRIIDCNGTLLRTSSLHID